MAKRPHLSLNWEVNRHGEEWDTQQMTEVDVYIEPVPPQLYCDECDDATILATTYCDECGQNMCDACNDWIHKGGSRNTHILTALTNHDDDIVPPTPQAPQDIDSARVVPRRQARALEALAGYNTSGHKGHPILTTTGRMSSPSTGRVTRSTSNRLLRSETLSSDTSRSPSIFGSPVNHQSLAPHITEITVDEIQPTQTYEVEIAKATPASDEPTSYDVTSPPTESHRTSAAPDAPLRSDDDQPSHGVASTRPVHYTPFGRYTPVDMITQMMTMQPALSEIPATSLLHHATPMSAAPSQQANAFDQSDMCRVPTTMVEDQIQANAFDQVTSPSTGSSTATSTSTVQTMDKATLDAIVASFTQMPHSSLVNTQDAIELPSSWGYTAHTKLRAHISDPTVTHPGLVTKLTELCQKGGMSYLRVDVQAHEHHMV